MRAKIDIVEESDNEKIVILSKDLSTCDLTSFIKEQKKFVDSDTKQLEYAVDMLIYEFLGDYGLVPKDTSKNELEKVFDTLKTRYGKNIEISDCYKTTNEKVVNRRNDLTIIIDKYKVIQCAITFRIVDYK